MKTGWRARARRMCVVAAGLTALVAGSVQAQSYPTREIRVICGYAAGTGADIIVRYFAEQIGKRSGKPVIVENKPGAYTNIAAEYVKNAKPDGYTLFITAGNSTFASNPHLYKSTVRFDPMRDYTAVTTLLQLPFLVTVNPKTPVKSMAELQSYLKAKGDKASHGYASTFALAASALYRKITGLTYAEIPYKATPQALTDLLSGELDVIFMDASFGLTQHRNGRVRALAVTPSDRSGAAPELPTMIEAGVAGYDLRAWWAAWLPANAPRPVVDTLAGWLNDSLKTDETKKFLLKIGGEPWPGTPEMLAQVTPREYEKWGALIRDAKIEPQ